MEIHPVRGQHGAVDQAGRARLHCSVRAELDLPQLGLHPVLLIRHLIDALRPRLGGAAAPDGSGQVEAVLRRAEREAGVGAAEDVCKGSVRR